MAESFNDRITSLKQQTDDDLKGRLRFGSALLRTFPAFILLAVLLNALSPAPEPENNDKLTSEQRWQFVTNAEFEERVDWLRSTALIAPGGAALYEWYAETVVSALHQKQEKKAEPEEMIDLGGIYISIVRSITSLFLRTGFVLIALWPLWIVGAITGFTVFRRRFRGKRTDDLLGVCDRGSTPFYSGLYGPLRPNNSFSATDLSCPNLACPQMATAESALAHRLGLSLKRFGALNQTNLDLSRVILQYRDYPSFVEGEQAAEEVADQVDGQERTVAPQVTFVSNANGTIETSSMAGLDAALSAHEALRQYVAEAQRRNLTGAQLNANYAAHRELLDPIITSLPPLGKLLACSLTPNRAFALGRIPSALIASAFLATEAGKCLVYRREGSGFSRISRYPHLQARAVIQSLVSFGREYNGDTRLVIRQAIICSRRHGDFGRAFLPDRMPVESRALRDWLEVLYEEPAKREMVASLVEQDAHIEEISVNWRGTYARRVRQSLDVSAQRSSNKKDAPYWKGIVYKSVVLVPMPEVVGMALRGVDEMRIKRVAELLKVTRKYQTSISISARLPGFKRQAVDAENTADLFTSNDPQRLLFDRWLIVRRMLTRYNWLSTRVGDDAVPPEGYVQGLVLTSDPDTGKADLTGLEMLVPIRQRRYEEMFGKSWEGTFFIDSPHPNNIRIFVDRDVYQHTMKREQENLKKLTPITAAKASA